MARRETTPGRVARDEKLTSFTPILPPRRATVALLTVLTLGLATAGWLNSTPSARSASADDYDFSADRAIEVLGRLLGDESPHPIGSTANHALRDRLIVEIERLGLEPETQTRFVCGTYRHYCGTVHNVLVRIPGGDGVPGAGEPAVVLNAHYDSQGATPGAGDAVSGVASSLEIARALLVDDRLDRDVILLFNDGEEAGLLGAFAFVLHHRWADDVVAFVNLEARGSGGPSVPAYTIGADRAVLGPYASGLGRRAPGSAIGALSALLPAANDIVVFDQLEIPGVTLGFTSNIRHYHTPLDDLAHLDAGSVQQQGDAALRIVRAAASGSDPREARGRLTFVAVGPVALRWPEAWTPVLSWLGAVGVLAVVILLVRAGIVAGRQLVWGLLAFPLTIIVAFFGSAVFNLLRRQFTTSVGVWISRPEPTFFGFWAGAALLVAVVTWAFRRGASPWGFWAGGWLWWSTCGAAVATMFPGFGYLFFVPTLAALLAGGWMVVMSRARAELTPPTIATFAAPALVTLLVWLPQAWFLKDFIGLGNMPPVAFVVALALTGCAPLFAGVDRPGRAVAGLGVLTVVLLGIGTRVPVFSDDAPQWANVFYSLDADSGEARWFYTGFPVPPEVRQAGGFTDDFERPLRWTLGDGGAVAAAPIEDLPAPEWSVIETIALDDSVRVRARVRSARGAPFVQLAFGAETAPSNVSLGGEQVPADAASFPIFDENFLVYTIWTVPDSGLVVEFTAPVSAPIELHVADRSYDLPRSAAALREARPSMAVPIGGGDATVVFRAIHIDPDAREGNP